MASTPFTTANLYTPKQENKENVPKWELNFVGFLTHGGYFFAYEGFWKFFVFRRRINGCASGIIFWLKSGNSFQSRFYEVNLQ